MGRIEYIAGDGSMLDRIGGLWAELNAQHADVSPHFAEAFRDFTFDVRKKALLKDAHKGLIRVDIAVDTESRGDVAYCISSIHAGKRGEIDSIYVQPPYRKAGVGNALMERAIAWLEAHAVREKTVGVAYGNESAFAFYAKFGFFPRLTILRQKPGRQR